LAQLWADVLGVERVGVHDNFFELGGDSILSIQVIAKANQAGLRLTPRQIFQHPTVAEQADVAGSKSVVHAEQDIIEGPVPLTPIQRWFLEQELAEPQHWNHALLFEVREPLRLAPLRAAVEAVLAHHDALRLRVRPGETGWEQVNAGLHEPPVSRVDLSDSGQGQQAAAIEREATALQRSLDLADGPLVRVALFDLGGGEERLLIIIHHFVVDGVSWQILLEDLLSAYRQAVAGTPVRLPVKTTSFRYWAERLERHAEDAEARRELDYWLSGRWARVQQLPVDFPGGRNDENSTCSVTVGLTEDETRALLQEVPAASRTEVNEVLLTAFAQAIIEWTGSYAVLVDVEGHGREHEEVEEVDVSRTVGWFTTIYPVLIDLPSVSDPGDALKQVKEQLRLIPRRGFGYGVLRYLGTDSTIREALRALPQAEISFNYLGQLDQMFPGSSMFGPSSESVGPHRAIHGMRSHLLAINGGVARDRLELEWSYSADIFRRETVEEVAQGFLASLRSIIRHCLSSDTSALTPSDFPLANLSQAKLDKVIAKLNR
jgi:non-ribosomal peptide synthase protein (TIGR01720 family)